VHDAIVPHHALGLSELASYFRVEPRQLDTANASR
jgi:hypothetical protein